MILRRWRSGHSALCAGLMISVVALLSIKPVLADSIEAAQEFWNRGELTEAVLVLKEQLRTTPDDIDARLLLASVYLDLYQADAAEHELRKAQSAGAPRGSVLVPQARALLLLGSYRRVLDEIAVATVTDQAEQAQLAALRGDAHRGLLDNEAARAEYERALALDPGQLGALLGMARLALADGRVQDARELLVTTAEAQPEAARAWELLAELDFALGDYASAEQSLVKAVVSGRNKWMPRFKRSLVRLELGKLDAAEADINAVAEQLPNFPGLLFARGALMLKRGETEAGLAALNAYLKVDPTNLRALYLSAVGEIERGNVDLGMDLLQKHLELAPDSVIANQALAQMLLRTRDPAAAEALLRPALLANPGRPGLLLLLAQALVDQRRPDEAMDVLNQAVELVPDAAEIRVAAAENLQRLGRADEALEQLDKALALDPLQRSAPLMQIKMLLEKQEYAAALEQAERLASARADDPAVLNALALAQLGSGNAAAARVAFEAALAADPQFPDAALNLAKLELRDGDTAGARELLETVAANAPGHEAANLSLAELDGLCGDIRGQQTRLREAVEAYPAELSFRLALARSYLANGNPDRARTLLQAASEEMRQQPDLLLVLAQSQLAMDDLTAAVQTLQDLSRKARDSATPHYLLATAFAKRGDVMSMEDALITAVSMEPGSPLLRPALDLAMERYEASTEQLALVDKLLRAAAGDPRLTVAKVDLLVDLYEHNRAQQLMRDLLAQYPDDVGVMRKLVAVLREGNDYVGAIEILKAWLERYPDDATAQVMLSQVQAEAGQPDEAQQLLESLLDADQRFEANPLILNNLAWLLRDTDPERALSYAERALRGDPKAPAIKDTLGILLVRQGSLDRGLQLLEEASIAEPTDPTIRFHYAEALTKAERGAEARLLLLNLLEQNFPEKEAAKALLQQLGG